MIFVFDVVSRNVVNPIEKNCDFNMFISKIFNPSGWTSKYFNNFRLYSKRNTNPATRTWDLISREVPGYFGHNSKPSSYPEHVDIVIIGGGFIGSAAAYSLKLRAAQGLSIVVIEKDMSFKWAEGSFPSSTLVHNFVLPENIYLSKYGSEFLRKSKENLGSNVNIQYRPTGQLVLASENYADKLEQTATLQREMGIKNELLTIEDIKERFPWINTNDIKLGYMGVESEGEFDSKALLKGLVEKSHELGTVYINAEVTGFELEKQRDVLMEGVAPGTYQRINKVLYKTPDNEEYAIKFAACILAAGGQSGQIAKLAKVGIDDGLLSVPLPIENRQYAIYSIETEGNISGLNTPTIMDTSGLWLKRNGLENNFIFGHIPFSTPDTTTLSEDEYYKNILEPSLYNRFPQLKGKKVQKLGTGIQDFNAYDESGILGPHPYHNNLYIAAGFGKYGCQHAPGIGRAIAELIIDSQYTTVDLTRLGFDRILTSQPLVEYDVY